MTLIALTDRFQQDRAATFVQLYELCFPAVARWVKGQGGNQADAEDIFQDCMVALYEKTVRGQLPSINHLPAYVTGMARHHWHGKEQAWLPLSEAPSAEHPMPDPPLSANRLRLFQLLAKAGQKCMELLEAFYYQRLSATRLAEEFGYASARSATVQKHKCLEKVRAYAQKRSTPKETAL